jgi:hypothetical protein
MDVIEVTALAIQVRLDGTDNVGALTQGHDFCALPVGINQLQRLFENLVGSAERCFGDGAEMVARVEVPLVLSADSKAPRHEDGYR